MYRIAILKLLFAIATICIPISLLFAFVFGVEVVATKLAPGFHLGILKDRLFFPVPDDVNGWYMQHLVFGLSGATSLVIWIAAIGVNRSDEVRAGALSILVIVCYVFVLVTLGRWFIPSEAKTYPEWFKAIGAIGPCGPIVLMSLDNPRAPGITSLTTSWPLLLASALVHVAIACSFVTNFGRTLLRLHLSESAAPIVRAEWLAPPRRSRIRALVWKQFRESGPLALIGMSLVFALSLVFGIGEASDSPMANWLSGTFMTWASLGFFVAIVAGIGVFIEDYRPGVEGFWGSLPIRRDIWFWVKFSFGISITLLVLLMPFGVILPLAIFWGGDLTGPDHSMEGGIIVFMLQAAVFSAAAFAMIVVRQAIYAAVFAIAFVTVVPLLAEYFRLIETAEIATGFVAAGFLATFLAWLAVRYNWSLRR